MRQNNSTSFPIDLTSFFLLYSELLLIRYLPAYIHALGYFTNIILIASFLGTGLGFLLAPVKRNLVWGTMPILLVLVLVANRVSPGFTIQNQSVIYFQSSVLGSNSVPILPLLLIIFILTTALFATIGQMLGRYFKSSQDPVTTYIWDLVGSILGVIFFYIVSIFIPIPTVWFVIVAIVFLFLIRNTKTLAVVSVALFGVILVIVSAPESYPTFWSPYYKITMIAHSDGITDLFANNMNHQFFTAEKEGHIYHYVFDKLAKRMPLGNVLIIGSGTGQDVAAALSHGAGHVDAVEIDPMILAIGNQYHPLKPYQNPNVTVYNDDGRHFLETTKTTYDLIVFAVTDSLIVNSNVSQIRLESYLFTKEAFVQAFTKLRQNGRFVLYNNYRKEWLITRLEIMLTRVFGKLPPQMEILGPSDRIFTAQKFSETLPASAHTNPAHITLPSDDWPFFYLQRKTIPTLYLEMLAGIIAISIVSILAALHISGSYHGTSLSRAAVFFFLGAAFSLVETKSIAQLSQLFGTTWIVTAIAVSGILIAVLLATLIRRKVPTVNRGVLIALLFASLALQYAIPVRELLILTGPILVLTATIYFYIPIVLANLIFVDLFSHDPAPALSLAANIFGLVFGGVMEYSAIIVGYTNLLPIVGLFYAVAVILPVTKPFLLRKNSRHYG